MDDKAVIVEITRAVFNNEAALHLVEFMLRVLDGEPGESIWIVECEQFGIVGFLNLRVCGRRMHLDLIAVRPHLQRRGLGHSMMLWLIDKARAEGFRKIKLHCRANERAQFLYRRIGFIDMGKTEEAYADGVECLMMEYDLVHSVTSTNGTCQTKQVLVPREGATMNQPGTIALIPFLCTDADGNMMLDRAPENGWLVYMNQKPDTRAQVVLLECDWETALAWLHSRGFRHEDEVDRGSTRHFSRGSGADLESANAIPVLKGCEILR